MEATCVVCGAKFTLGKNGVTVAGSLVCDGCAGVTRKAGAVEQIDLVKTNRGLWKKFLAEAEKRG